MSPLQTRSLTVGVAIAVLVWFESCLSKPTGAVPNVPIAVAPIAALSSAPPPAMEDASASMISETLDGVPTDGPFPSLAAYCKSFKHDCLPTSLCRCDVENAGPNHAIVRTRDGNREDENGMVTDFTAMRPAFHRSDGWRVASVAPDYQEGAETGFGGSRTRASLARASSKDVLGDGTLEEVYVLHFVHEEDSARTKGWQIISTSTLLVICGEAGSGYCTKALEWDSRSVPALTKDANGELLTGDANSDGGLQKYRLVVAPRAP